MVVIAHQAEGIEHPALLEDFLGEQIEEDQPILIVLEDRLLAITPGGEVVERSGKLQTQGSGHCVRLRPISYKV
jgi:hypothetical protein